MSQDGYVRSLGGEAGRSPKTMHQETKTKLSSATPNRDKTIHCQRKHRKHPAASNVAAEHLTHAMLRKPTTTRSKQFQTIPNNMALWQRWQHAGGATVFSGILSFRHTCKRILLVKLRHTTGAQTKFFFLECGRCRTMARSFHEHKQ